MSGKILGLGDCKLAEVSMKIVRANGKIEDLGVVSYYHKNPLRRIMFRLKQWLGIMVNSKN